MYTVCIICSLYCILCNIYILNVVYTIYALYKYTYYIYIYIIRFLLGIWDKCGPVNTVYISRFGSQSIQNIGFLKKEQQRQT